MTLTETNLERYSRNILLPEIGGKGQQKLLNSKVLVVGAGYMAQEYIKYLNKGKNIINSTPIFFTAEKNHVNVECSSDEFKKTIW